MILLQDRRIADKLIRAKLWKFERVGLFETPSLVPCWGTRWLYRWMLKRQTRDGLHHAPMCPSNEWSGAHLVVMGCNCGAARKVRQKRPAPAEYTDGGRG